MAFSFVSASGAERKQIFQSLHDIRLVKNFFSPGPLDREATEKYFPARDR